MNQMSHTHSLPTAELEQKLSYVLDAVSKLKLDAAEMTLCYDTGFEVAARSGDVETLEHQQAKSIDFTCYKNKCKGSASSTDLDSKSLDAMIEKAHSIATYTNEDPCAGIASEKLLAFDYPDLQLHHRCDMTPRQAIDLALQMDELAQSYDPKITQIESVDVSVGESIYYYANTHGFIGHYCESDQRISCSVVAEQAGVKQTDYEYSNARKLQDLQDYKVIATSAADKALQHLGARKISTRRCPVIFSAHIARGLLSCLVRACYGSTLYNEASFLKDSLNQMIFPEHISIAQRPHLLGAMGSAPFDGNGVSTMDRDYVTDGRLVSYVLDVYSARKLNMQTTGNAGGVFNLQITHSDNDLNALLAQMDTGLLVTSLMGQGINLLTGDYSRGATGFWVAGGVIQYPVEEITVAGNLRDMFASIVSVANDIDKRGSIQTGSILIEQMMVAGDA